MHEKQFGIRPRPHPPLVCVLCLGGPPGSRYFRCLFYAGLYPKLPTYPQSTRQLSFFIPTRFRVAKDFLVLHFPSARRYSLAQFAVPREIRDGSGPGRSGPGRRVVCVAFASQEGLRLAGRVMVGQCKAALRRRRSVSHRRRRGGGALVGYCRGSPAFNKAGLPQRCLRVLCRPTTRPSRLTGPTRPIRSPHSGPASLLCSLPHYLPATAPRVTGPGGPS